MTRMYPTCHLLTLGASMDNQKLSGDETEPRDRVLLGHHTCDDVGQWTVYFLVIIPVMMSVSGVAARNGVVSRPAPRRCARFFFALDGHRQCTCLGAKGSPVTLTRMTTRSVHRTTKLTCRSPHLAPWRLFAFACGACGACVAWSVHTYWRGGILSCTVQAFVKLVSQGFQGNASPPIEMSQYTNQSVPQRAWATANRSLFISGGTSAKTMPADLDQFERCIYRTLNTTSMDMPVQRFGTSVEMLARFNNLTYSDRARVWAAVVFDAPGDGGTGGDLVYTIRMQPGAVPDSGARVDNRQACREWSTYRALSLTAPPTQAPHALRNKGLKQHSSILPIALTACVHCVVRTYHCVHACDIHVYAWTKNAP